MLRKREICRIQGDRGDLFWAMIQGLGKDWNRVEHQVIILFLASSEWDKWMDGEKMKVMLMASST